MPEKAIRERDGVTVHSLKLADTCVMTGERRRCKAVSKIQRVIGRFLCSNQELLKMGQSRAQLGRDDQDIRSRQPEAAFRGRPEIGW